MTFYAHNIARVTSAKAKGKKYLRLVNPRKMPPTQRLKIFERKKKKIYQEFT